MNPLGEQVLLVAKQYLGPAAQQFLSKELRVLQCTADTITPQHLPQLAERAKVSALRIMDAERAGEFAQSVVGLGVPAGSGTSAGGGREGSALEAAAHLYSGGKLRQAEEAYRALVQKHADPDAYRGLAATQVALEDIPAALLALRDGAAIFARRGDRTQAIVLLTEAVGIAPGDLAAHRRLAAAHANAGDTTAACAEYERFVDHVLAEGDSRRAWLELTYARETLGDLPDLIRLVDRLMPGGAAAMPTRAAAPAARAVSQQVSPPPAPPAAVRRLVPDSPAPQKTVAADLPKTKGTGSQSAMVMADARTMTSVDAFDEAPVDLAQRIAPRTKDAQRKLSQAAWHARPAVSVEATLATLTLAGSPEQQAAVIAMRATVLIGARDPRATEVAIDAARRFLSMHKLQAASDLLLDYIGAGYTDREAQRLLIEVDCGLGRRDVARDKCRLLGEAYRLDGRIDIANDVERLASMI
jgi:tetratricopeptide (TPR) repeat protein